MNTVVRLFLISILLGLFSYQSWKTIIKYRAEKSSLQVITELVRFPDFSKVINKTKVTLTDDGSILFPSITICKDEMYDKATGLIKKLQSGELEVEDASTWFRECFKIGGFFLFL